MSAAPGPLDALRRQLTAFVSVLEEESSALASADIDGLADSLAHKNQLASATSAAWNEAMTWLRSQSTGRLNEGLEVPAAIQPYWQDIVALAKRAEALNQRNGQLIDSQLQRTRGAIEVLQAAARPLHLYGADGHMLDLPGRGHTLDMV
jgi:flagella synthesis protein FlgN